MTQATSGGERAARLPLWQVVAYTALPLALAGMVPWYTLALLCGIFALCAAYSGLSDLRISLGALVLGGASIAHVYGAVQAGDQKVLVASIVVLVAQMLALWLVSHAADTVSDQRSQVWLYVLVPALFAPHPLALLGLVGAALLRYAPDDRVFERRWQGAQRSSWQARWPKLWPLGLAALGVVAAATALPRASLWGQLVDEMGQTVALSGTVVQETYRYESPSLGDIWDDIKTDAQHKTQSEEIESSLPDIGRFVQPLSEILAVMLAAMLVLAIGLLLWRRADGPSFIKHRKLVQAVALLGFPMLLAALFLTAQFDAVQADIEVEQSVTTIEGGDTEGFTENAAGVISRLARSVLGDVNFYNLLFLPLALTLLVVLAAIIYQLLRAGLPETAPQPEPQLAEPALSYRLLGTEAAPLHRVRHAYARVEAHLESLGLPRRRSETPAEFLARVAGGWPAVAAPLGRLASAYAPVRYGGGVSESEAAGAEASAEQVLRAAPPERVVGSE